jgi:hypothetical protein
MYFLTVSTSVEILYICRVSESKNQGGGVVDGPITGKYKYRSSFRPPSDEDILGM